MADQMKADLLHAKGGKDNGGKKRKVSPLHAIGFFILLIIVGGAGTCAYVTMASADTQVIAHGVTVQGLPLGGMTADEATAALNERLNGFELHFELSGSPVVIDPKSGDKPIVTFDIARAVQDALAVGHVADAPTAITERMTTEFLGTPIDVPYVFDRDALRAALETRYSDIVQPEKDARFAIDFKDDGSPVVNVEDAVPGTSVDYDSVMQATDADIRSLSDVTIVLPTTADAPKLSRADLLPLEPSVIAALQRTPLTLTAKTEMWTASARTVADWIIVTPPAAAGDAPGLSLDHDKLTAYLQARATPIETAPQDAQYAEKDGKVVTFVPEVDGETIDVDGSETALSDALFSGDKNATSDVTLPLMPVQPEITTEKSNPYGIKEIIGVGATNFKGSPKNRIHNIGLGAASVNGTLIAPGEEFSMVKTLGEIDATTGYLEELVIKDNKTEPDYGGGLCQIGSTAFRAALDTGLPITMRQNHSYRVPYYERDGDGNDIGPGKDATIYDPMPDFRFVNDTGHEILILTDTDLKHTKLTFTFWGVRDGRVAEQTSARVYNIVPPPPEKTVPTTDLQPGAKKCTELAHPGSDAVFSYKVTYADGTVKNKDFYSHYKPWQEVCLIGVLPSQMPPLDKDGNPLPTVTSADAAGAAGN
jgi:vancomycin resistance protein YoaR